MDQRNLKKARKDAETSEPSSKINPSEALEPEKKKAKIVKAQKSTKPVKATGTPKSQIQNAAMKEAKDTPKSDNDLSSKTKEASGSGTLLDLGKTEDEVVNVHDSEMSTNSQIISKEKSQIDEKHQEKLGEALEPEKRTVKILKRKKSPNTVKATATPKSKLQNAAIIEAKGTPKSDNDMSSQTNEASGTLPDLEKTEDEVLNAHDTEKSTNSSITNKEEIQIDEKHRDKLGEVLESGKKKVKIVKIKKSIKKATGTPKSQLQNAVMREAKGTTKSDKDMSSNSKEASGALLDLGKTVVNAHDSDSQITNTEKSQNEKKHQEKLGEALEPNKKKVKKVKGQKSAKTVKATSTPKSKLQNAAISEGKGTPKSENNMSSKTKEASGALQDQEKIKNEVLNARDKGKSTNSKVIKKEKSQIDDKHQEKLGGLIFMCNSKTKSDCFKYKVMGLPAGHQELVRSIKPGRKLFLYDVGQKLLYGIYSASAAGGMKLEPNAFDGSYPAQVRFKVHKECLPLPESVFKKAIEENYIEKKRWFKTELTVQQVQKLTKLFLASKTNIPTQNTPQKPLGESAMKSQSEKVHKDLPAKDRKSVDESRRYYGMPPIYQRGQVFSGHQETVPSLKLPRDPLFLSEKEYRAFGLVREPIQTPEAPAPPQVYSAGFSVDPNLTGRDHPHQNQYDPTSSNLYPVPPMRATAATSTYPYEVSMFPDQMDYHERGSERRLLASQAPRQATSAAATLSYGYPGRAEIEYSRQLDGEIPSSRYARSELSGYEGGRTRTGETERLNPTYAFGAATDYERRQPQLVSRPQLEALPVSSRYSFAGPSLYYS